jgi:relA/spoT protein
MQEHNRLIDVYWNDNTTENYAVEIEVLAVNTSDILKNIIQVIEKSKSSLLGVEANVNKLKLAVIKVKIIVKNHEELNKIMNSLKSVENVLETSRKRG